MKNKLYYSPEALKDLDEIWEYISLETCNLKAADRTIGQITAAVDRLEDFAQIGTLLSAVTEIEGEYRFLVAGKYLVFYREENHKVFIDRVLHSKRNYLRVLFPDQDSDR